MVKLTTVYITHYPPQKLSRWTFWRLIPKMYDEHPRYFYMSLRPSPPPTPFAGEWIKFACRVARLDFGVLLRTMPNWIHSLHQLPLLIFVAFKMALSKASVFDLLHDWLNSTFGITAVLLSLPLPGQIYLRSERQKRDVWIRPNSNRGQNAGSISNSLTLFFKKTCFFGLAGSR